MKLRCKDGDLALVIHDEDSCRPNIGKLVRVAGPVERNHRLDKDCWLIEPIRVGTWCCVTRAGKPYLGTVPFQRPVEHPDDWLLPIDPQTWPDEEVSQTPVLETT